MKLSKDFLEQYIDVGMRGIIYKLNKKDYITQYCCEGHLSEDNEWHMHIYFGHKYATMPHPPTIKGVKFKTADFNSRCLGWDWYGVGEKNRVKMLRELESWVDTLPMREPSYHTISYGLRAFSKRSQCEKYLGSYADNTSGRVELVKEFNRLKNGKNYSNIKVIVYRSNYY